MATTSNYQQLPTYRRCVGWDVPKVSMELPRVVSPPQRVPRKHRDPNPKSPRESGLGFETVWEIPRNGWDVPDRKRWDPPADQPHTHTSMGDLAVISSCPREAIKTGKREKWRREEKGERRNRNLHMLPTSISRRKRWGDSPAFFVRNVRRAFLF